MYIRRILVLLAILSLFSTCRPLKRPVNVNFAHLYNSEINVVQPEYSILHHHTDSTKLTIYINPDELLYVRDATEDFFTSRFQLSWYLFESFDSRILADSARIRFTDTLTIDPKPFLERTVNFATPPGTRYTLFTEFEDLNRRSRHQDALTPDKLHPYTSQFFLFAENKNSVFSTPFFLSLQKNFEITYAKALDFELSAHVFPVHDNIPVPPFVITDNQIDQVPEMVADTSFVLNFRNGKSSVITSHKGLYHFHEKGNSEHGFVAYAFHPGFPDVSGSVDMLRSLRYITSSDEYQQLFTYNDPMLATERFWNRSAGNPDRARELKNRYFNRVNNANILFTSFVPGWQTDRGMIYIIFGPPHSVFKTENTETWRYTEGINIPSATFTFNRIDNKYSYNHFALERDQAYRSTWNHAVSIWRR
ncbi:MAG: GWxTD domain-containing protein [Bacteroidales bacterium]|nr:GWxTD domain-containing protein [Bacteroidales bacterium]